MKLGQYSSDEIKDLALSSLFFFDKFILGFNSSAQKTGIGMEEEPHRELCDFIQDWDGTLSKYSTGKKKKLVVVPRKCLKTSIITVGYSLFELAHDPSMTILLDAVLRALASDYLGQIRDICEGNEVFRACFGDWVSDRNWTSYYLDVKGKPKGETKDHSISTAGVDSAKVAYHPRLKILDDLIDRDTVRSPEALQKVIRHYRDLVPMGGKQSRTIMPCTRWDADDLVSWILENEPDDWDVFIRSAIKNDGTAYYPQMLPLDWVKNQLDKDPYFASCQYINEPINPSTTMFDRDDIEWYEEEKELPDRTNYLTCDPAGHEGSVGDKTAIVPGGVDKIENIYFYEPYFDRFKPDKIIDIIFNEYIVRRIKKVGIEHNYYRGELAKNFERRGREWGTKVRVEELKHYGRRERKADRIRALQPYFKDGKIFLKGKKIKIAGKEQWVPVGKNMKHLYQQIISYPRAKMSDDLIDAAAMFLEIIKPSGGFDPDKVKKDAPIDKNFGY